MSKIVAYRLLPQLARCRLLFLPSPLGSLSEALFFVAILIFLLTVVFLIFVLSSLDLVFFLLLTFGLVGVLLRIEHLLGFGRFSNLYSKKES